MLRQEWFDHPEWWFDVQHSHDDVITTKFQGLFVDPPTDPLSQIILYDQVTRHVFRHQMADHIITFFLRKATSIVKSYMNTSYYAALNADEFSFFMMPFRHSRDPLLIKQVLSETWKRILRHDCEIYKRYLRATYSRFIKHVPDQTQLMQTNCQAYVPPNEFTDILAYDGLQTSTYNNESIKAHLDIIDPCKPIIISLSGGVDSMVCAWLIRKRWPDLPLQAVHINYDNRHQCAQEVLFLKAWCAFLDISLYVRTIDEIHRAVCMKHELRELYESYTRNVRYACYKSVADPKNSQIILGHNNDDCFENIMTNLAHGNKYENLLGMQPVSVQDGVCFKRPLLHTPKDDIIRYAKSQGIPFLPNSTPSWSQRGQIRESIVPALNAWDVRMVPSLYSLDATLKDLYDILDKSVSHFIDHYCDRDDETRQFTVTVSVDHLQTQKQFWRLVFKRLFGINASNKSLQNLENALNDKKDRTVIISKDVFMRIKVEHNQMVLIMNMPSSRNPSFS